MIYIIPLIAASLLQPINKKFTNVIVIVYIGTLLLIRENVGYDYANYQEIQIDGNFLFSPISNFLLYVSRETNFPNGILGIIALTNTILLLLICLVQKPSISILAYVCLPFFYIDNFTTSRQSLAITISMISYIFYNKGQNQISFAFYILATLTHVSAIISLPLFYILKLQPKNIVIGLLGFTLVSYAVGLFDILESNRLQYYISLEQQGYFYLIICSLIFVHSLSLNSEFIKIATIGLSVAIVVHYLGSYVFYRFLSYIYVPYIFISTEHNSYKLSMEKATQISILVAIFALTLFVKVRDDGNQMLPFETIF